jgi:hypothetical protein
MTAKQDENKMVLSVKAREETCKAHSAAVEKFMEKPAANVVGLAEGDQMEERQTHRRAGPHSAGHP